MNGTRKRVVLIRHATTDLAGTLCGQLDPPLNDIGIVQAESLCKCFASEKIDRIYTSNLRRAAQTAEAIATPLGVPVLQDENLQEISFGDWEGRRWADLQSGSPEEARRWLDPWSDAEAPNGENMTHFRERVRRVLASISIQAPDHLSLVVTHLGILRVAFLNLAGIDPESDLLRAIRYCSAYEFHTDGQRWTFAHQYAG